MIYCIWYPSGGFGHFINALLSLYGDNFVRPRGAAIFSTTGNLHELDTILPKYQHNQAYPPPVTDPCQNYCVLIDNGINDESSFFKKTFPQSSTIKICYDDRTWPIVAHTMIVKAMNTDLTKELPLDKNWDSKEVWAKREKFFLYLRDHPLRYCWKPDQTCYNLQLETILRHGDLKNFLDKLSITTTNFQLLHDQMLHHNQEYLRVLFWSDKIIEALDNDQPIDISHISNIWDQAAINYFLYVNYGIEIPANDYADWFQNTAQIKNLL